MHTQSYKTSPYTVLPSRAFLIAAPHGGCPSPSTWPGGDIHLSARACVWVSLLQPCGAEGAKNSLQTVNICFFFFLGSYHRGSCTISSLQLDWDGLLLLN